MPEHRWFPEFRDEQAGSRYPFADTATLASDGDTITIHRAMFVDASIYPIGGTAGLGIMSVIVGNRTTTIRVGGPGAPSLCDATFDPLAIPAILTFRDPYGRPAGVLVCDPVLSAAMQSWPLGTHVFSPGAAAFAATCTIPIPGDGVRGLFADGRLFTGDVWIVGDGGVVVSLDAGRVRFDIVGDPLSRRRLCGDEGEFATPRFVKTINGAPPDDFGNFQIAVGESLAADTILRIIPVGTDTLKFQAVGKKIGG